MVPVPLINTSFLIDLCENMVFSPKPTLTIRGPQGVGGGGYSRFQVTGMIELGAKVKTQETPWTKIYPPKNPLPIFQAIKISKAATQPGYAGTITNRQVVLNTLKKSLLKSS